MNRTAMPAQELTCQQLVELVTDYLEGALSVPERARFEAHLAMCHHCAEYLVQMRRTIQTLGRLTEASLDAQARHDLLQLFRTWKHQQAPPVNGAARTHSNGGTSSKGK